MIASIYPFRQLLEEKEILNFCSIYAGMDHAEMGENKSPFTEQEVVKSAHANL